MDDSKKTVDKSSEKDKMMDEREKFRNYLEEIEKSDKITLDDVKKVIAEESLIIYEYNKNLLTRMLCTIDASYKYTSDAKEEMSHYVSSKMRRYIDKGIDMTEDEKVGLEYLVDFCVLFSDDDTVQLLNKALTLPYNNIRYYAVLTLIGKNQEVSKDVIFDLAHDLEYASNFYSALKVRGKEDMFPQELNNRDYLAKSNMVGWLCFPTELGEQPSQIEMLGTVYIDDENYYIFKYMSNSDKLSPKLRNQWLIGFTSDTNNTFSGFDLLSEYEQEDVEATIDKIYKELMI